jgi:biopolymer transport protein ExbD
MPVFRYKPQAGSVMSSPNVIPMADIMLVLLIIFMVVTPMLQKGISVDLAQVSNPKELPDADKDDAVIVAVSGDGKLYLQTAVGTSQVRREDLTKMVKDIIADRADKTVFLKSDARAKYGVVVGAVDEIRSAGVDQLGLLTQKQRVNQPPRPPGT